MTYTARVGILRRAIDWFTMAAYVPQTFAADPAPRPIAEVLLEMAGKGILPRVTRDEALSVPAVLRARNLICSPATLPLVQKDADRNVQRLSLLEQIDPNVANVVTLAQTFEDLLFYGVAWWRVLAFGADGYPVSAQHVDHGNVSLQPPGGPAPNPLPGGHDPRGAVVYVYGEPVPVSEVIRFDSPNPGLLTAAGRPIQRAVLLDTTSSLYADNPRPLDYFTPSEDADPATDADVKKILDNWNAARKTRGTAYVPAALRYNSVDTPTPADLQLIEQQRKAALDLANATGLDPEDLGISTTSRTYQNATDRRQDRINDVLSPYMKAVTDRLSMGDVTKRGYRVTFDLDDYLRADPKTRAEVYHLGITDGWLDRDEVRAEEGRAKLTAAQRKALAPVPAAQPAAPPAALPDNVRPIRAAMAADPDAVVFAVDAMPLASTDPQRRVIEGIAVPYGPDKIAFKNGRRYRFQQGSIVPPADLGRNKMLRDHDQAQPQGKLTDYADTPAGMFARYKIFTGPDGDRTLIEAAEGKRDGLSVGVDIHQTEPDPLNQGVLLVSVGGAKWTETSVLAVPAFDDARVTRVAAQRDKGESMDTCATCGAALTQGVAHTCAAPPANNPPAPPASNPPADPPAPALQLSADQQRRLFSNPDVLRALMGVPQRPEGEQQAAQQFSLSTEQLTMLASGGFLQQLLGIGGQQAPEQRQVVDATRRPAATTQVVEQPAYRFDRKGNLTAGKFDFSSDVIAGLQGDKAALERATSFVSEQFQREEFVIQSDVSTLNPPRQRPDLYVDQKEFAYPIWNAIEKGTIPDATPFVLPKFSTSSGLVANHTEGTEPSLGAFQATSQTITPSPVSGKIKISREAWDQGGNPQLSGLIWRQMTRAWFEALESAAVTMLEGLAPTTITITTAAADAALEASITSQLAPLQYVRGGFTMRDFFVQVDLYKALIAAKDSNGRKLFPIINAQNATGTTSEFFADILVAGLRGRPAWALAATSVNSSNSYLFDRGNVSGWATAPNRLSFEQLEVANVYIGLWGYKAMACTDLTGVRRLAYDPV